MGDRRLGVVGIVVENLDVAETINAVLHTHAEIIVGRMGIPCRERGVSVISLIVDGENDTISAMTGQLGRIPHVTVKTALAKNRAERAQPKGALS